MVETCKISLSLSLSLSQSPKLEARLAKLRAKGEQKEYNRMVANVDPMVGFYL